MLHHILVQMPLVPDRKMDINFVFSDPKNPRNAFSRPRKKFWVAPLFVRNAQKVYVERGRVA